MAHAKQTVIVKKGPRARTRSEASRIARRHADRLYTSRETGTSFRFRQRPPECFVDGSMRTACFGKGVCVVYGELKRDAKKRKACR